MLKNHVVIESASFSASCKVSYRILSHPISTWMACETAALSKHRTSRTRRTVRIPVRQKCPVRYTRPSLLPVHALCHAQAPYCFMLNSLLD